MTTEAKIEYRANPLRQGGRSRRGTQVDREFVERLLHLLGDVRALWLPEKTGTTLTDRSRNARVLTWSEEISAFDASPEELGSGYAVILNGTDEEGDTPDADDLSFGTGVTDNPFSVLALVNPSDATSSVVLSRSSGKSAEDNPSTVSKLSQSAPDSNVATSFVANFSCASAATRAAKTRSI